MLHFLLLSGLIFDAAGLASIENRAAEEGASILKSARTGEKVRQCSCDEEKGCEKEMKEQALSCVDPCWDTLGNITSTPDVLRECFDSRLHLLHTFVACFVGKLDACVKTKDGPMIEKTSIKKLLQLGQARLQTQKEMFLQTVKKPAMRTLLQAAGEFSQCIKECFEHKNKDGFCYDKIECQPLIEEKKMMKSLKTCLRQMQWKEEVGEACDCLLKAGVSAMAEYCPLLRAMKSKTKKPRT